VLVCLPRSLLIFFELILFQIAGENACVNGGFAQCVGGKFAVTECSPTLICAALPLVNSRGTSITCTTQADALARIQATGATGGISG
jgi:hypothetical protein